jgi:hypothetical protein
LDSVRGIDAGRDASVIDDSVTCRRGRDARRRNCWRAEAAKEGGGREQQDKAVPYPLWKILLLNHHKALTTDAIAGLQVGPKSSVNTSASRHIRVRQ